MCFIHQTSISLYFFLLNLICFTMCECESDANKFDLMHLHISLNKQGDHRISVRRNSSSSSSDSSRNSFLPLFHSLFNFDQFLLRSLRFPIYAHAQPYIEKKIHWKWLKRTKCNRAKNKEQEVESGNGRWLEAQAARLARTLYCICQIWCVSEEPVNRYQYQCKLKWLPTNNT